MTQLPHPVRSRNPYSTVLADATVEGATGLTARIPPRGVPWLAQRIVVQGPTGSICRLYIGDPTARALADGSQSGALDVADYYQPLYVEPSLELVAVWLDGSGVKLTTGAALLRVQLREV